MSNAAGFRFFAGLKGSNVHTVGKDDSVFGHTDISIALDIAKPGDLIKIYPGTYTLTSTLAIRKNITLVGVGGPNDVVITSALATRTVSVDLPVSHNANVEVNITNIKLTNSSTGSAITIDNANAATAAYNLYVSLKNCSITNTGGGYAVELLQTTATKDIFLTIEGVPVLHSIGLSLFTQTKAASWVIIFGMNCTTTFALDASALAATFDMFNCVYTSTAQTAGAGIGRLTNYAGNIFGASGLGAGLTKGITTDFDALGTKLFITYA